MGYQLSRLDTSEIRVIPTGVCGSRGAGSAGGGGERQELRRLGIPLVAVLASEGGPLCIHLGQAEGARNGDYEQGRPAGLCRCAASVLTRRRAVRLRRRLPLRADVLLAALVVGS